MHIYLDESFQLKKGEKNQFLLIAGFATSDPKRIAKLYNRTKKHAIPKRMSTQEIKSTNPIADRAFKPRLFRELAQENIQLYAITQLKDQLPHDYFSKGALLYDRLYFELLKVLLVKEWDYQDKKVIIATMDSYRSFRMKREEMITAITKELTATYPDKYFRIQFLTSELQNLQLADQICGVFYQLMQENQTWFDMIKPKLKKIVVNPLSY